MMAVNLYDSDKHNPYVAPVIVSLDTVRAESKIDTSQRKI